MTVKIYINNRPLEDHAPSELATLKEKLTETAMKAAGYIRDENNKTEK